MKTTAQTGCTYSWAG